MGEGLQVHKWAKTLISGFSLLERASLSPPSPPPKEFPEERKAAGLALTNGILKTAGLFRRQGQSDAASVINRHSRPGLSQPEEAILDFRWKSSALPLGFQASQRHPCPLCTTLSLWRQSQTIQAASTRALDTYWCSRTDHTPRLEAGARGR